MRRLQWIKAGCVRFEIFAETKKCLEKARKAGYRIVQEPRKYDFGTDTIFGGKQ